MHKCSSKVPLLLILAFVIPIGSRAAPVPETATSAASGTTSSGTQTVFEAYLNEQQALGQQFTSLIAQGATPQQLQAWAQQNAAQLAAQRQRGMALSLATGMAAHPANQKVNIPANATPMLRTFLLSQEALNAARSRIHSQLLQQAVGSGKASTMANMNAIEANEERMFLEQNATALQSQVTRLHTIAASASQQLAVVPVSAVVPANAAPAQAAFMQTRNQLRRSLAQLRNAYANATPAAREAALASWREQNAALLAQFKQQAQNLSQSTTN